MNFPIQFWILASESWILVCHVDQHLSRLNKWLLKGNMDAKLEILYSTGQGRSGRVIID
jgi:hypothetical protein